VNSYVYPLICVVTSLLGIAVVWGMLKATVERLGQEVDRLRDAVDQHQDMLSAVREEMRVGFAKFSSNRPRRAINGGKSR
jgi:hypothetical protein